MSSPIMEAYGDRILETNVKAGFVVDDPVKSVGTDIALMHSELSEALEAFRTGPQHVSSQWTEYKPRKDITFVHDLREATMLAFDLNHDQIAWSDLPEAQRAMILRSPEGIPSELADIVIRVVHFCMRHNIDLDTAMKTKMAYNDTREYGHGKKNF